MLILLHGALGAAATLLPLQQGLAEQGIQSEALDFSGHGQADWPTEGFSMSRFEEDVLRFMDERGIESAHLFGYSMGGFVALRLALHAPARIRSVCTLATMMDWTKESCAREAAMLHADKIEMKVPRFVQVLAGLHAHNGWQRVVEATRVMIEDMHLHRLETEHLQQIQQPCRIMLGDRDAMVSLSETEALYRTLPNASMAVLPQTSHPLDRVNLPLLTTLIAQMLQ